MVSYVQIEPPPVYPRGCSRTGSSILLERGNMGQISVRPIHIGAYLSGLLKQRGSTADQLAEATGLSSALIAELIVGQQILTADVALVLGEFFEVSPLILLEVQSSYCIAARAGKEVKTKVPA
jgi:plasmid maintenance system antidote protein VapI